jgi:hypothetical protein
VGGAPVRRGPLGTHPSGGGPALGKALVPRTPHPRGTLPSQRDPPLGRPPCPRVPVPVGSGAFGPLPGARGCLSCSLSQARCSGLVSAPRPSGAVLRGAVALRLPHIMLTLFCVSSCVSRAIPCVYNRARQRLSLCSAWCLALPTSLPLLLSPFPTTLGLTLALSSALPSARRARALGSGSVASVSPSWGSLPGKGSAPTPFSRGQGPGALRRAEGRIQEMARTARLTRRAGVPGLTGGIQYVAILPGQKSDRPQRITTPSHWHQTCAPRVFPAFARDMRIPAWPLDML